MAKAPRKITTPLGMLEWDSIAAGLEATDGLFKQASVEPILVRPVTPGRYVTLFTGEVESVRSALKRGADVGEAALVDSLFLPQPHVSLVPALGARTRFKDLEAVGVIETLTLCSLLLAADAAAKTGEVSLVEIRLAMGLGGKAFCVLSGEVSQVESAVSRGSLLAKERGYHLRSVVIPNPDAQMAPFLTSPTQPFSDLEI